MLTPRPALALQPAPGQLVLPAVWPGQAPLHGHQPAPGAAHSLAARPIRDGQRLPALGAGESDHASLRGQPRSAAASWMSEATRLYSARVSLAQLAILMPGHKRLTGIDYSNR